MPIYEYQWEAAHELVEKGILDVYPLSGKIFPGGVAVALRKPAARAELGSLGQPVGFSGRGGRRGGIARWNAGIAGFSKEDADSKKRRRGNLSCTGLPPLDHFNLADDELRALVAVVGGVATNNERHIVVVAASVTRGHG